MYIYILYILPQLNNNIIIISTNSPQNELPPKDLTFSIIRIPNDGQKLSPPSLELDDGLYILLRSQSKAKLATIPSNLRSLTLLTDGDLSEIPHCPWSLSGPQYPRRAGERVQQRYCYPRGVGEYSNGKGGSMWTVVNKKGQEDIDCRLLHVYHSSKRADNAKPKAKRGRGRPRKEKNNTTSSSSTNTTHTAVGTRKSKRKKSQANSTFHQDDEENDRKKMKITATTSSLEQSSSLMQGDLLKSPNNSFDTTNNNNNHMNANLDFTGNIFDTTTTNTTFMPVQNEVMMMNNPAFNSAAAAGVVPGYYGQYAAAAASHHAAANCITYPPPIFGGGSSAAYPGGDYWTMSSRAPSIPELASSFEWQQQQQPGAASTTISSVDEFSKRLKDMEAQLTSDIEGSKSTDQVLKLHLLQQWAKGIAQRPLQPNKSSLTESKTELSSQAVDDTTSMLPMEITEKKDQADEQPMKTEDNDEDICSTTEVVLKEASTALAKTNLTEVVKTSSNSSS